MCVVRSMPAASRCERSARPVSVGVNTSWPCARNSRATRCQHQPPCQAPCTSTKVCDLIFPPSNLAAVIGPVQQCLALPLAAGELARLAIALDLPQVPADQLPAPDLARILVRQAAPQIVATVPLEPAARIVLVDPALAAPHGQGLAGIDPEEVERGIAALGREL